jgi:hypothetical protein
MSFINYTDVAISLDGASVFASSASINNSLSMSPVRAVGIKGAAGMIPDGPATAECSIDLVGGAGYTPKTDLSNAANCETVVVIGSSSGTFLPTSFSISMSPNEVVSGSFSGTSFEPIATSIGAGTGGGASGGGGSSIFTGGHGAAAGSSGADISAEYNWSASWDAIYFIGSMCPQHKYCTEGSVEATVSGNNISGALTFDCSNPCPGAGTTISFTVGSLCGGTVGTYEATGYVTGGGVEVSEGGVLTGTQTVIQFLA